MTNVAQEFERDYRIIRRMVLQGKTDIETVKLWLKKQSKMIEEDRTKEFQTRAELSAGFRADRDMLGLFDDEDEDEEDV